MAENVIAPPGEFRSLSYLKEGSKLRLLIDVYTMFAGALVSVTILNLEKIKENQKLELQKDG